MLKKRCTFAADFERKTLRSVSSVGSERFLHTEEVESSNLPQTTPKEALLQKGFFDAIERWFKIQGIHFVSGAATAVFVQGFCFFSTNGQTAVLVRRTKKKDADAQEKLAGGGDTKMPPKKREEKQKRGRKLLILLQERERSEKQRCTIVADNQLVQPYEY